MKTQILETPNRENWKQFCSVPQLDAEELEEWERMIRSLIGNESAGDFVWSRTADERQISNACTPTKSWVHLVETAEAERRYKRAQVAAWREWKTTRRQAREWEQPELTLDKPQQIGYDGSNADNPRRCNKKRTGL